MLRVLIDYRIGGPGFFCSKLLVFTYLLSTISSDKGEWLTVIHTNDIYSHFDEAGGSPEACKDGAHCFGGVARLVRLVREARRKHHHVLVLDAGGLMNTELLQRPSGRELITDLVSLVGYDAFAIGEQELVGGVEAFVEYVGLAKAPFLCTNLVITVNGSKAGSELCRKSLLFTFGTLKVGVVGYYSHRTHNKLPAGVVRTSAVDAVKEQVKHLRNKLSAGLIIVLGYTQDTLDQDVSDAVPGIDLFVSGHSSKMFYNGESPHGQFVGAAYPAVVERANRSPLLVVGTFSHLHFVGWIELQARPSGGIGRWRATNPILLTGAKDAEAEAVMTRLRPSQKAFLGGVVGSTAFFLDGSYQCRIGECSLGSVVADAMLESAIEPELLGNDVIAWSRVSASMITGGTISASIPPGLIYAEDIRLAVPFIDDLVVVTVRGDVLLRVLEKTIQQELHSSDVMQLSGLRLHFYVNNAPNHRVQNARIICTVCQLPAYKVIDPQHNYRIVTIGYLLHVQGIGFDSQGQDAIATHHTLHTDLRKAVAVFVRKMSPIAYGLDGRIRVFSEEVMSPADSGAPRLARAHVMAPIVGLIAALCCERAGLLTFSL